MSAPASIAATPFCPGHPGHGRSVTAQQDPLGVATPTVLGNETGGLSMINGISAVTLGTHEMPRAVRFYRALGFAILHGGEESSFTSLRADASYLNLIAHPAGRRRSA